MGLCVVNSHMPLHVLSFHFMHVFHSLVYCEIIIVIPPVVDAVQTTLRNFYSELVEQLHPGDITAKLYTRNIISNSEKEEIDQMVLTLERRNILLLEALKRAINIDYHNFSEFLSCLDEYDELVGRIRNKLTCACVVIVS